MLQITDNFDYPEDKMAAKPKASGGLAKKGLWGVLKFSFESSDGMFGVCI